MHSTPAAGALLTGLTTLAAVAGCVTVSPDPVTGSGTGTRTGPGAAWPATSAPGPAASPLPGREELATISPVPHPRRTSAAPAPSTGAARPGVSAPGDDPPPAPETPAPRTAQGRPARTAQPAPPPPTSAASGGAGDLCALAGDYGRWAPGSREDAACAEYFER
ncbi:hypothetical protein OG946_02020 [Streptomyces sp. NBC_01808]|uniref:hypothetical protein n=1 Tax=Streptomyces sp. NBC_01808 TaxID=2975947 RepID=UPI002DD7CCD4|nr:hypothetical protein [Streptomyces sp. NBC_01808]WSA36252.1 hypothetical protein OG946_02020 [Streptomyces sp. NBC_01808]